ncbi:histidinol-phosphatase [Flavobacterium chungnamense]|uniref:D,D-heptose 1,7-bisphosphate phosphatase n=1 Tax=Flavobacterium chungnamense TaxID=706182 RepID=A0ABP7UX62_9FLAO
MKKILFIDRDGTIVKEAKASDYVLDSFEELEFYPEVFRYLGKIVRKLDFEIIMVTNQDGLGTKALPTETFWNIHNKIMKAFENEGIVFSKVFIDDSYPDDKKPTRKPGIGMVTEYIDNPNYNLKKSFMVGDRLTDMEFAKNLNAKGIFINNNEALGATEINSKREELDTFIALKTTSWREIYKFLKN